MLPENANKVACLLVEVAEHSQSAEGYRPRSGRMFLSADPIGDGRRSIKPSRRMSSPKYCWRRDGSEARAEANGKSPERDNECDDQRSSQHL